MPISIELPSSWWSLEIGLHLLLRAHITLEKNFNWICPENLFDESSVPKCDHKGSSKTHWDTIQFIVENTPTIDLNASFDIT
jgi:hypothetical protein